MTATASELRLRLATAADEAALVRMGQRFLTESSYKEHLKNNPAQMIHFTRRMLACADARILVAEEDGEAVGMLVFYLFPHFFSGEPMAGEIVWWVEPERRAGSTGLRLLREAERLAREAGSTKMQMIAPNERIGALYEKLGYRRVETTYQKELR
jgi:GNAT superfamily N-acetyltransferase